MSASRAWIRSGRASGSSTQPRCPLIQPAPPLQGKSMDSGQFGKIIEQRPVRHLHLPELLDRETLRMPLEKHDVVAHLHVARAENPVIPTRDPRLGDKHRHPFHTKNDD